MAAAPMVYSYPRARAANLPSTAAASFSARLLGACRTGDPQAWDRLFQESIPLIMAIARTDFGLHREDAEDVVQLVHLKLYEHLDELRDAASFTAWLRRVTRHTIIDLLRHKRQTVSLDALADETGMELPASPLDELPGMDAGIAIRLDVQRALASLPPLYREPVIQYLVHGKGQDEIGRLLGRPRSTIATQIQRGLEKLRCSLEAGYGSGRLA
jgi:RNA polymerase sigma-70 factor, ECF subfamily